MSAPELLETLRFCLIERRVTEGFRALDESRDQWALPNPADPRFGALVGWVAQWVDLGYPARAELREIIERLTAEVRSRLPVTGYCHVRMADATLAMADEEWDAALRHLDFVLGVAAEAGEMMIAIAHYWKARVLRQKGDYEGALSDAREAERIATALRYPRLTAIVRVLESWLLFQRGRTREAWTMLDQCEPDLRSTDDYIVLGNIQSAYGRMLRRQGRYQQAIAYFERSLEEYRHGDPTHRNVARSLANMAYVKRLLALQWKRKIDADAAGRRKTAAEDRGRFAQLRGEALENLREAGEIYTSLKQHHGAGTVQVNRGLLHLDGGDLDLATAEARSAFDLGREKNDLILMARARILQCMIENAKVDEQVDGASPHTALDHAREAIEMSRQTQNSRLLARAHLWEGLTLASDFYGHTAAARTSLEQAMALVRQDENDPLWVDLQTLRSKVHGGSGAVDSRLRAWSEGQVGNKTLQQLSEEFAEIVIAKVWEQEGRKVARVAKRLKVSPKKVRRVLGRASQ